MGRYGSTYAHWQIALAYAKYLDPELHIWCNEVVVDRFELMADPDRELPRPQRGQYTITHLLHGGSVCSAKGFATAIR